MHAGLDLMCDAMGELVARGVPPKRARDVPPKRNDGQHVFERGEIAERIRRIT